MKKLLLIFATVFLLTAVFAQEWKPAGDKIKTPWANKVDPSSPLPEYPRPQMVREMWQNLNGLWNYAILPKGSNAPQKFDGNILVPFAIESSLSGVQKTVGGENELWYQRSFSVPTTWKGKRVMLNFGAVDWKADVWLNDTKIGSHQGGYAPFSFDVTSFLIKDKAQNLVVTLATLYWLTKKLRFSIILL